MLTPDQVSAGMGAALDQIEATIADHERAFHSGKTCAGTRYYTVAWIAHRLGLRLSPEMLRGLASNMTDIEADCPHCKGGRK